MGEENGLEHKNMHAFVQQVEGPSNVVPSTALHWSSHFQFSSRDLRLEAKLQFRAS
jgi:hypothetical protein